jgi:hypothetical protein
MIDSLEHTAGILGRRADAERKVLEHLESRESVARTTLKEARDEARAASALVQKLAKGIAEAGNEKARVYFEGQHGAALRSVLRLEASLPKLESAVKNAADLVAVKSAQVNKLVTDEQGMYEEARRLAGKV